MVRLFELFNRSLAPTPRRSGFPPLEPGIPSRRERLEEHPPVTVDDQQVSIAVRAAARHSTLNEVRLGPCGIGDRAARFAAESCIAFAAIFKEGDRPPAGNTVRQMCSRAHVPHSLPSIIEFPMTN
jgi:hypothetical protein